VTFDTVPPPVLIKRVVRGSNGSMGNPTSARKSYVRVGRRRQLDATIGFRVVLDAGR